MRRRVFDHVDPYLAPPWREEPQPPEDEMTEQEQIEAAAEAMWTLLAEREDDPERSACRNGPRESELHRGQWIKWRSQRWDEASGAWRQEMLDMAAVALAAASSEKEA